jgi:hypothetical protein
MNQQQEQQQIVGAFQDAFQDALNKIDVIVFDYFPYEPTRPNDLMIRNIVASGTFDVHQEKHLTHIKDRFNELIQNNTQHFVSSFDDNKLDAKRDALNDPGNNDLLKNGQPRFQQIQRFRESNVLVFNNIILMTLVNLFVKHMYKKCFFGRESQSGDSFYELYNDDELRKYLTSLSKINFIHHPDTMLGGKKKSRKQRKSRKHSK